MSNAERARPSFENTQAILANATAPIDRRTYWPLRDASQPEEKWIRMWEMVGEHVGIGDSLDKIGKRHDLSRERVRQLVKRAVINLYPLLDPEVQARYPLESLGFAKPRVERAKGAESLKKSLNRLRTQDLTDQEIQEVLNSVGCKTYTRLSKGENPLFTNIRNLAKEAGLFIPSRQVHYLVLVEELKKGIPVGLAKVTSKEKPGTRQKVLRYYFIFSGHKQRAVEVLQSNPAFDRYRTNPIRALRQTDEKTPSLSQLVFSGAYSHVNNLLAELGHARFSQECKLTISDLIANDCPVPVFRYRQPQYFYPTSQKEALKTYLAAKIEKIRRTRESKQE